MSTDTAASDRLARLLPDREALLIAAIVINTELLLLGLYWVVSGTRLTSVWSLQYWLYPLIWIDVSLLAVWKTTPTPTKPRNRRIAALLAVGYFALLAYVGGIVGPANPMVGQTISLKMLSLPPGFSPALSYNGTVLSLVVFPYKLIGYATLAYLVYATVLDAAGSAVTGVLGLLSCVSCTWPVLASLATGVLGSGSAIAGAVYSQSYGLSTLVFVVTVGLLYWRPFGR